MPKKPEKTLAEASRIEDQSQQEHHILFQTIEKNGLEEIEHSSSGMQYIESYFVVHEF